MKSQRPYVGQPVTVRGVACEVIRVYRAGTVDVAEKHGPRAWRVTGLAFR